MNVSLSDLKVNVGRYVDLAETEDVVITKYGKPVAKIIGISKAPQRTKKFHPKSHQSNSFLVHYLAITNYATKSNQPHSLYAVHNGRRFFIVLLSNFAYFL